MKTVLDTMPFTPIAQFLFHEKRYLRTGNRKLKLRVLWYRLPKVCYVMRTQMWFEAFTLRDFECSKPLTTDTREPVRGKRGG